MPLPHLDNICLECFDTCTVDMLYANGYMCEECAKIYIKNDLLVKEAASSEVALNEPIKNKPKQKL